MSSIRGADEMELNPDSALEAFAHCCTGRELEGYLSSNLSESGRERLKTHGHLALAVAVEFNKEEDGAAVVSILLEQQEIQVNLPHIGEDGNTVLHLAVLLGDDNAVSLLFQKREDLNPNVGNRRGETPLHVAAMQGSKSTLELLLSQSRSNVAVVTCDKRTVLHVACAGKNSYAVVGTLLESVRSNNPRFYTQILSNADELGRTALHYAAESGPDGTVTELLDRLAGLEDLALAKDKKGCMAVHLAVRKGLSVSTLTRLLRLSDRKLDAQITAGHHANGSFSMGGTDPEAELRILNLYLELLAEANQSSVAEYLFNTFYTVHVVKSDELGDEYSSEDLLRWAITGRTSVLLIPHILKWHPELANKLFDSSTGKKQTILHAATVSKNQRAVQALCMESAVNANKRDAQGYTALDHAFEIQDKSIQRILMARQDVREHLAKLHTTRETYSKAANSILVVAVLVATLTYLKCVGKKTEMEEKRHEVGEAILQLLEYSIMPTRLAFFLSTLSCLLASCAALPFSFGLFFVETTDDDYVRRSVRRTRVLVVVSSYCLVLSLEAILFTFICSQYISMFTRLDCALACMVVLLLFAVLSVVFLGTNGLSAYWSRRKRLEKESRQKSLGDPQDGYEMIQVTVGHQTP